VGLKTKIVKLVRLSHEAEQSYIEEKTIVGKSDDWAPKDILAHMTAWKEQVVTNYQAGMRGDAEPEQSDYEVLNAQFFEKHHPRSWEEILDYREQTQQSLLNELKDMSEADLNRTEGIPMQRGRPFWRVIVGIAYVHPLGHLRDPILARGDFDQAVKVQEQACRLLSELDDDEAWKGAQQYNLACTYSLVGQKENAIRILRKALKMTPELMKWSKEDPDFKPIREHPDYKAIYS